MGRVITERRFRKGVRRSNRYSFNHGLGDGLMFRSMMANINKSIDLWVPDACGYRDIFNDCWNVNVMHERKRSDRLEYIKFYGEDTNFKTRSGRKTKPRICQELEFGSMCVNPIRPRYMDLSRIYDDCTADTFDLIKNLGPYVVFHGQGISSPGRKNCALWLADHIVRLVKQRFRVVVMNYSFSYRFNSHPDFWFVDGDRVISTKGWPLGVASMWNVLNNASAFIGVDSGPLHLALTIPTLPCVFIRKNIDFTKCFYDGGLYQIRSVIEEGSSFKHIENSIETVIR